MRYLGGKARLGKDIAQFLSALRLPNQLYLEPFVGAGWVAQHMQSPCVLSDVHVELIALWQSLQQGWIPPERVSEEEYQAAMRGELSAALTAFIGFGCSFGGKYFGGYARSRDRNYASNARNSLLKKTSKLLDATFCSLDYRNWSRLSPPVLIYCDPPYQETTGYKSMSFNSAEFWDVVRQWRKCGHTVVVSEYQAPSDFCCVKTFRTKTDMHTRNGKEKRLECLFM